MSVERAGDESTKAPGLSTGGTAGLEDDTQTNGTAGAPGKLPSPPGGGTESGKGEHVSGRDNVKSPAIDSTKLRELEAEKKAPAPPPSAPRLQYSRSGSRRKRKKAVKKAAMDAVEKIGTIEDGPQETEPGGSRLPDRDAYPGEYESNVWKQLELFKRANMFQRFPVEASPEQLVADLCETYVKTIELTMEKRYRNICFNRWLTVLLSCVFAIPLGSFIYKHMYTEDDLFLMTHWSRMEDWPLFLYPMVVHLVTVPFLTLPLGFCHRHFHIYMAATYAYTIPLFSICIATAFILFHPSSDGFEAMIELAISGAMHHARHLEDHKTEDTRENVADVYMRVAVWAFAQSLLCAYCFHMSLRSLSALRYYQKYSYEASNPPPTAAHIERSALVGQCTRRVPLTQYKNFADIPRTPRTPGSPRQRTPNSPQAATAIGETTPLL